MKLKLTLKSNNKQEEDLKKENNELKKRIDILENENKLLKIKLIHKDQTYDEHPVFEHGDKENRNLNMEYSCEKCSLHFSGKEET